MEPSIVHQSQHLRVPTSPTQADFGGFVRTACPQRGLEIDWSVAVGQNCAICPIQLHHLEPCLLREKELVQPARWNLRGPALLRLPVLVP